MAAGPAAPASGQDAAAKLTDVDVIVDGDGELEAQRDAPVGGQVTKHRRREA